MTEMQRDEILLKLLAFAQKTDTKLTEHDKQFKKINSVLDEHNKQFEKINSEFTKINSILYEHDKQFEKINSVLDEHSRQLQSINNSVVLIEVEYKDKLSALFDAFKINSEKINEFHEDFKNIHSVLEKHEDQIFLLNQK